MPTRRLSRPHREAPDLDVGHVAGDSVCVVVLEVVQDVVRHHLADRVSGTLPWATARTAISRSVIMPTNRSPSRPDDPGVQLRHQPGRIPDGLGRFDHLHPGS